MPRHEGEVGGGGVTVCIHALNLNEGWGDSSVSKHEFNAPELMYKKSHMRMFAHQFFGGRHRCIPGDH